MKWFMKLTRAVVSANVKIVSTFFCKKKVDYPKKGNVFLKLKAIFVIEFRYNKLVQDIVEINYTYSIFYICNV